MPARSKQQQKLFGLALAVKKGDVPKSDVSKDVKDIVDKMSKKDIGDMSIKLIREDITSKLKGLY